MKPGNPVPQGAGFRFPMIGQSIAPWVGVPIGVSLWMLFVAGVEQTVSLRPFIAGCAIASVVLGTLSDGRPSHIGAAFVAGPLLLLEATVDHGDGDGLYRLWYPVLLFLGVVFAIGAGTGSMIFGRASRESPTPLSSKARFQVVIGAVLLSIASVVAFWPRPYGDLETALRGIGLQGFEVVEVAPVGSIRGPINPGVKATLTSSLGMRDGCRSLLQQIRSSGVSDLQRSLGTTQERCHFLGTLETKDLLILNVGAGAGEQAGRYFLLVSCCASRN